MEPQEPPHPNNETNNGGAKIHKLNRFMNFNYKTDFSQSLINIFENDNPEVPPEILEVQRECIHSHKSVFSILVYSYSHLLTEQ